MEEFLYRARPWVITLVDHNWPVMFYALAILWAAIRAYVRPTRRGLLILYAFLVLAVAFEYQKHGTRIAKGTTDYLLGAESTRAARQASQFVLLDIAPVAAHALGVALLSLSVAGCWSSTGTDSRA